MKRFTTPQLNPKSASLAAVSFMLLANLMALKLQASPDNSPAPVIEKSNVQEIKNLEQWEKLIKDPNRPTTAVKFVAPWCGWCKKLAPIFAEHSLKYDDLGFASVDVTDPALKSIGEKYGIQGFPQTRIFKPGQDQFEEVDKVEGANFPVLKKVLQKHSKYKPTLEERVADLEAALQGLEQNFQQVGQFINRLAQQVQQLSQQVEGGKGASGAEGAKTAPAAAAAAAEPADPNVTMLTSQDQLNNLNKNSNTVVMLSSKTCPHCKEAAPKFAQLAAKHKGAKHVKFAKANFQDAGDIFTNLGVQSAPTFAIYKKGADKPEIKTNSGEVFSDLEAAISKLK